MPDLAPGPAELIGGLPVTFTATVGDATAPPGPPLSPHPPQPGPGPITAILPAITVRGRAARMDPIPGVGQHTQAILEELGLAHPADEKP